MVPLELFVWANGDHFQPNKALAFLISLSWTHTPGKFVGVATTYMRLPSRNRVLSLRHVPREQKSVSGATSSAVCRRPTSTRELLKFYLISFSFPQMIDSDKRIETLSWPNRFFFDLRGRKPFIRPTAPPWLDPCCPRTFTDDKLSAMIANLMSQRFMKKILWS